MSLPSSIVSIISKVSPGLGAALGGPAGGVVGTLISTALGVDMNNTDALLKKLTDDPQDSAEKLKKLELQISDLQQARDFALKAEGTQKLVRPFLAFLAMLAVFIDIIAMQYITNPVVDQILIVLAVFLVWDIRQIYNFYFGKGDDPSSYFTKLK